MLVAFGRSHTPTMPVATPPLLGPFWPAALLGTNRDASPNKGKPPPRGGYVRPGAPAAAPAPAPVGPSPGATPSCRLAKPAAASSAVAPAWPFSVKPARPSCSNTSAGTAAARPGTPPKPGAPPAPAAPEGETMPVAGFCSSKYVASGVLPVGLSVGHVGLTIRGCEDSGIPAKGRPLQDRRDRQDEQMSVTWRLQVWSTCYAGAHKVHAVQPVSLQLLCQTDNRQDLQVEPLPCLKILTCRLAELLLILLAGLHQPGRCLQCSPAPACSC